MTSSSPLRSASSSFRNCHLTIVWGRAAFLCAAATGVPRTGSSTSDAYRSCSCSSNRTFATCLTGTIDARSTLHGRFGARSERKRVVDVYTVLCWSALMNRVVSNSERLLSSPMVRSSSS
ncbi:hypothetical protein PR001_g33856, partial [Phytophthora rubi]